MSVRLFLLQVVETAAGQALAEELGIPFVETSAKSSTNISRAFAALAADIKASIAPPVPTEPATPAAPAAGIRLESSSVRGGLCGDDGNPRGCC